MKLKEADRDDPDFVGLVTLIVDAVIAEHTPNNVTIIQIDNWFDHKWLAFSGKALGAIGVWKRELTFPPFNPNRVVNQTAYRLSDSGEYEEIQAPPLHVCQESGENLNRKVKQAADSAVFVWWTGNTVANGRGSVMVYTQVEDESTAWFLALERRDQWRIDRTQGIPLEAAREFITRGEQAAG